MLNTIQIVQVRARDVPSAAIIRVKTAGDYDWRFVYNVASDEDTADTEDVKTIFARDLDDRYVILRLSNDPKAKLITGKIRRETESRLCGVDPSGYEITDERPDRYVVLAEHDLVEMQVVVGLANWTDDQA